MKGGEKSKTRKFTKRVTLLQVGARVADANCDWILEKRSKSHVRSFEINGFKEFKPA